MSDFERLLNPRAIAVIGASADPTRSGGQTVDALGRYGYAGAVYPVNPKYPTIGRYACYASPEEVPLPCDVAVIALPARRFRRRWHAARNAGLRSGSC
jgi:acyl-CoA synthetase (NDP forming)